MFGKKVPQVRPDEAKALIASGAKLVDVREENEWREARIPGAMLIPLGSFAQRWHELPSKGTLVLQCRSGARSQQAAEYLLSLGRGEIVNLAGGIDAWARAGLPVETSP